MDVQRRVPSPAGLTERLTSLLEPATLAENNEGLRNTIPDSTHLNHVSEPVDGVITVDLTGPLAAGAGQRLALAQIVFTATAVRRPVVTGVLFYFDGVFQEVPDSTGAQSAAPRTRDDYREMLAAARASEGTADQEADPMRTTRLVVLGLVPGGRAPRLRGRRRRHDRGDHHLGRGRRGDHHHGGGRGALVGRRGHHRQLRLRPAGPHRGGRRHGAVGEHRRHRAQHREHRRRPGLRERAPGPGRQLRADVRRRRASTATSAASTTS